MAGLKSITDLPMAENTSGVNLIVNDNGVAKQADLNAVRTEQEYDLNFEIKSRPIYGTVDYIEYGLAPSVSQNQLNTFWSKVKNGEKVKILLEMFDPMSYRIYNYTSSLMSFQAHKINEEFEGYATAVIASEEEGYFGQIIKIVFNETEVMSCVAWSFA